MTPAAAFGAIGLAVSIAAILIGLGRILQRVDDLAKAVTKIDETYLVELRRDSNGQASSQQLLAQRVEAIERRQAEHDERLTVATDLGHELVKDLAGTTRDVQRHDAELGQLRQRVDDAVLRAPTPLNIPRRPGG